MDCCIGTSDRKYQLSVPLTRIDSNQIDAKYVHLDVLAQVLDDHLDWKYSSIEDDFSAVSLRASEDAHLLKCAQPVISTEQERTILGIEENHSILYQNSSTPLVQVECFRPNVSEVNLRDRGECTVCCHPKFQWSRKARPLKNDNPTFNNHSIFKVFDFSTLQAWRRLNCNHEDCFPSLDSPGSVCHFLRSIVTCNNKSIGSACASPWKCFCTHLDVSNRSECEDELPTNSCNEVIAILMSNQIDDEKTETSYMWDRQEKNELQEIMRFRTGDACPNFVLYSVSNLKDDFKIESLLGKKDIISSKNCDSPSNSGSGYTLLVYRHLPPRLHFKHDASTMEGGLLEYAEISALEESSEKIYNWRMSAPPYQDVSETYGDLLKNITSPENLRKITEEASKIPQWTAWPEKNHYESDYTNENSNEDSSYPASWTVFPLCHTFPANDVSARKWIDITCSLVPKTSELLKKLGPSLRTALFSRLEPRTILGAHTGWADLANHVFRVHIPLKVPHGGSSEGLCGTWVDGMVETHENERVISFDDSKTHRAFNYSDEERIVLIIDLARPEKLFPKGTSTGGHTDELDSFINQFT
jgi:hypothetical protein